MPTNIVSFECIYCDFKCSKKSNYNKHLITTKHMNRINKMPKNAETFECDCGKTYTARNSLWYHKQKCNRNADEQSNENDEQSNENMNSELITKLLLQNQEFKKLIIEQQQENQKQHCENQQFKELIVEQQNQNQKLHSQLIEAVKDGGNTINNNTTNNNQKFNLNFFLNTTCKDAMNMSDFIENMEVGFKDIENIGKNGYVSGMTDMILSRIKELDVTKRPLHCTDLKRETMYIKDNDEWSKDTPDNSKLHKTIKCVAKRNYATIPLWRENYPECQDWNHPKYDFCVDMMRNILGDIGDEQTKLDNKVIRNLSKHIVVNKE